MAIWSAEIKEIERLNVSLMGNFPELEKEMGQLVKTEDENVALLYSRRCLEVIITDLCECELKRSRGTEPLKGIIDKLNKEEKVPANIVASMHGLNTMSTFGTHPKDFDPEQVKPALGNLAIILKWYLKYKGIEILNKPYIAEEDVIKGIRNLAQEAVELEKSVAILPFINDSKDEENTYFINGLMEEILNNLQKIKDLRVISRTSVEQYRNQTKPIPEIAKELGVNYIVEGSGQKYQNTLRLRVQLIKAGKERHLWGESYQQDLPEVSAYFDIQSQIALEIATELNATITPQEKQLIEKLPTNNSEAYDAYLKGQFYYHRITPNDMDIALQYFELAKKLDPKFALAYVGIGSVWLGRQVIGAAVPEEAGPKVLTSFMKALELDSTIAEVHYTLAIMNTFGMWEWKSAESEFKKSIAINPNHADTRALYSHLLNFLGRPNEAMEQIGLALKLDPQNPSILVTYCHDLLFVPKYDEAVAVSRELFEKNPTMFVALDPLFQALHLTGRYEEAFEVMKNCYTNMYKDFDHVFDQYDKLGYTGTLSLEGDTLLSQSRTKYIVPLDIAYFYIFAGKKEKALICLEQAYELHDPNMPYITRPTYALLRDEPRFQDLLRKLNLTFNY